jgi:spermidine/putrescine-binding protein
MYNKNLVKESEKPKSWKDLADPKWEGKISYGSPAVIASGYNELRLWLNIFGNGDPSSPQAWNTVKAIMMNSVVQKDGAQVFQTVGQGELPLAVTFEYAAYTYVAGGANVGIIYPEEGTMADPEGIGIIKNSPHPNAARLFVDWLMSKEDRILELSKWYRRPARTDIDVASIVPGLPSTQSLKLVKFSYEDATKAQKGTVDTWLKMMDTIPDAIKARSEAANAITSANDTINKATAAGKTVGIDEAKTKLKEANDAFNAYDFATAKSKAEEASNLAGTAKSWMDTYGTTLTVVIVAIVILASAALIIRSRRKKT